MSTRSRSKPNHQSFANKLSAIVDGWKNVLWENPEAEKKAKIRAAICAKCEHNDGFKCRLCGCPLIAKTRSRTTLCPESKWPE